MELKAYQAQSEAEMKIQNSRIADYERRIQEDGSNLS